MKKILSIILVIAGLGVNLNAMAVDWASQAGFNAISQDLIRATTYRSVAPSDPLGTTGFDVAFEFSQTSVDGSDTVLPKLKFQKGLPFGLDIAGYYSQVPTSSVLGADTTFYGAALSYAILDNDNFMQMALRGSYTTMELPGFYQGTTTGLDLSISKEFLLIAPYVGVGIVNATSSGGTGPFNYDTQLTRYFVGANINLKFMDIAYELDNVGGVGVQSLKFGFRF